jgi:biopolymer transport protein ExbB/TolQ
MTDSSRSHALDCARRAAERAAISVHREFARGRTAIQAIVWTAPLLGMFGTAALLFPALRPDALFPCGLCDTAGGLPETFVPIALSLPVAILASIAFHYLAHLRDTLDSDMRAAILELPNHLPPSL